MKANSLSQPFLKGLYGILVLSLISFFATAQQKGIWVKSEVTERMTNLQEQKARCLPNCSFSAKSDDRGMNYEFNYYSSVDRKNHIYRGHVAWEWRTQQGPGSLVPGEKVTIRGVVSNLTAESGGVYAYAKLGNWGFMKPESGKSGDETARPNGTAIMLGSFEVPKEPSRKPDGTVIPYLYLTFMLSGGNEQQYIERTIAYKWTTVIPGPAEENNFSGTYGENSNSKVIISREGNGYKLVFKLNGNTYAEGTGTVVNGKLYFTFRRTDNPAEGGFGVYILNSNKLEAKHYNLDFSARWSGVYTRE